MVNTGQHLFAHIRLGVNQQVCIVLQLEVVPRLARISAFWCISRHGHFGDPWSFAHMSRFLIHPEILKAKPCGSNPPTPSSLNGRMYNMQGLWGRLGDWGSKVSFNSLASLTLKPNLIYDAAAETFSDFFTSLQASTSWPPNTLEAGTVSVRNVLVHSYPSCLLRVYNLRDRHEASVQVNSRMVVAQPEHPDSASNDAAQSTSRRSRPVVSRDAEGRQQWSRTEAPALSVSCSALSD